MFIGKLPIVNKKGELTSLIARTDLKKARDFPYSSYDEVGQLRVGAAINTRETARDAVRALVAVGVDVIVIVSYYSVLFYLFLFILYEERSKEHHYGRQNSCCYPLSE